MDLLHGGKVDGFCLVSSDSDFTRLATRIREAGLSVYGFGEQKTPKPFVAACDKFIFTEILRKPAPGVSAEVSVQAPLKPLLNYVAPGLGVSATISLLETFGTVKVLSSPKISVLNNQTAMIKVVNNIVYFHVETSSVRLNRG